MGVCLCIRMPNACMSVRVSMSSRRSTRSRKSHHKNKSSNRKVHSKDSEHRTHHHGEERDNSGGSSRTSGGSNGSGGHHTDSGKSGASGGAIIDNKLQLDSQTQAMLHKKRYKILQYIACGAYGQVYRGEITTSGESVAIKIIELSQLGMEFREKYLVNELAALTQVRHENIIRIYDIIRANQRLFTFMEFAPNGDLNKYIQKHGVVSEQQAQIWFRQVCQALYHLHRELRMAHRDIKLDNVLLGAEMQAKLTDFGFAKECWSKKRHCVELSATICGTAPYFAPQIMSRMPYNAYQADIWALGVMLFAMLNARFPFAYNKPDMCLLEQTNYPGFIRSRFLSTLSDDAVDLCVRILDPVERTRATLKEVLEHKWLKQSGEHTVHIEPTGHSLHGRNESSETKANESKTKCKSKTKTDSVRVAAAITDKLSNRGNK